MPASSTLRRWSSDSARPGDWTPRLAASTAHSIVHPICSVDLWGPSAPLLALSTGSSIHLSIQLPSIFHPSIHLPSIFHPSSIHLPSIFHPSSIHLPSIFHPSSIHLPSNPYITSSTHSLWIPDSRRVAWSPRSGWRRAQLWQGAPVRRVEAEGKIISIIRNFPFPLIDLTYVVRRV